ncbi:MAG TPA: sterol desaturase family protein [Gammaproteobacteria bacterium]|jgi:sterol desaturase/sphingolipid hydroxylase (fatty acid hydroxylase superfamily)
MLEFIYSQFEETVFDVGIGVAVWLVALALPFRGLRGKKEIGWDVVGYFGSAVFGLMIVIGLEEPILDWAIPRMDVWRASYAQLPSWAVLLLYVVAADLGSYWAHRLLHTRFLWDAHAWHHSPRYLYFLSGTRAAPIHIVVLIAPTSLAYLFFPYETAFLVAFAHAAFQVANQHYIHSNLWVPFPKHLEYVFVTPRFHFVHHARDRKYSDSNYGFIFSIWDRLFGTYTEPDSVPADAPLGLGYEIGNWRAFFGLPPAR